MAFPKFTLTRRGLNLLTIGYVLFFGLILVLAYTGKLPAFLTANDKLGHWVLYGIATYLGHRFLRYRHVHWGAIAIPLFPLLFGIFTLVEEAIQSQSPYRTLDAIDLVASFAGIICGFVLAEKTRPAATPRQP